MPLEAKYYRKEPLPGLKVPAPWKPSAFNRAVHTTVYYLAGWFGRHRYRGYRHHKSFSPWHEMRCWFRAGWHKVMYRWQQRHMLNHITGTLDNQYYLTILQVYNDSQIIYYSPYKDVREYIEDVIRSFARHAPKAPHLVFKHHPMDRGHRNYLQLIKSIALKSGISTRVVYVHDLPLDDLLSHARAVVTINSTVGMRALAKFKPLKVLGSAIYDIIGMTYQGCLDDFWQAEFQPDAILIRKFEKYLREHTQLNMEFYARGKNRMLD
jgi:capsular polysaccharide export protein